MKMRDDDLVALCQAEIDACLGGDYGEIGSERADAMDRYLGEPYGNETEGRSQVRTREVADTIEWILPSLMRIFFDAENAVEFAPRGPEDEQQAQQETERVLRSVRAQSGFHALLHAVQECEGKVPAPGDPARHRPHSGSAAPRH